MKKTKTPAQELAASTPLSDAVKAKIAEWNRIKEWLATGAAREMELRRELVALFVPNPKEGTNNVQGLGFAAKIEHKVTRTLDEAALDAVMPQLPENLRVVGTLIEYKPRFKMDAYRAMSADERRIFDQALTIKDGSPTLEIILAENAPAPAPATGGVDFKKLAAKSRAKRAAASKPASKSKKPARRK